MRKSGNFRKREYGIITDRTNGTVWRLGTKGTGTVLDEDEIVFVAERNPLVHRGWVTEGVDDNYSINVMQEVLCSVGIHEQSIGINVNEDWINYVRTKTPRERSLTDKRWKEDC